MNIKPAEISEAAKAAQMIKSAFTDICYLCNHADSYGALGDERTVQLSSLLKQVDAALPAVRVLERGAQEKPKAPSATQPAASAAMPKPPAPAPTVAHKPVAPAAPGPVVPKAPPTG